MKSIDYNRIASLYDIYVNTDYDFDFFVSEIKKRKGKILELTSGTGRLSIPLIEAGADLTCVDKSQGMLDVLSKKLQSKHLSTNIVCSDISQMDFNAEFELALFPFQSFMELVGKENQKNALSSISRALEEKGRFICTMHNPELRKRTVDSTLRIVGRFEKEDGTLVVSGFEQGGDPVVTRHQFFESYDERGKLEWKHLMIMQFELIHMDDFKSMAESTGFRIINLYGNYDRSKFEPLTSPVMIWELEKH